MVNYIVDPAKLFESNYERRIASILNSGLHVTNIKNYDERIVQKELVQSFKKAPEVVVIGSSRTMLIDKKLFPSSTFFNNSVSGAVLQDLIAIYQLYKENELSPDKILLGIDPWMFNENKTSKRWKSLSRQYNSFMLDDKVSFFDNYFIYKYAQLFSISYFQASINEIDDILEGKSEPYATSNIYNQKNTKLQDGSLVYGEEYRTVSHEEIEDKINKYIEGEIYGMKNFNGEYISSMKLLKKLCYDMSNNNIQIGFFLAPYPSKSYTALKTKYPTIVNLENEIIKFAYSEDIKVLGSWGPVEYSLRDESFYDGMHCKKDVISRIMKTDYNTPLK